MAARIAIIAITTNNSIRVKAQAPYFSEQFFRCEERFNSETLGTDWNWVHIRKRSNRGFPLEFGQAEKAGSTRAFGGNEETATHGPHRNDTLHAFGVHASTLTHCLLLILQFSSAKNFEHGATCGVLLTSITLSQYIWLLWVQHRKSTHVEKQSTSFPGAVYFRKSLAKKCA